MGYWFFMLAMNLLFPATMIILGGYFMKKAPKQINYIFGYRTNMSMKNKDTWEFAHKYMGKLWFHLGWLLIPISVISMLFVVGKGEDIVSTVGSIVMIFDLIILIAPIFPTESALRKNFDKDGIRMTKQENRE